MPVPAVLARILAHVRRLGHDRRSEKIRRVIRRALVADRRSAGESGLHLIRVDPAIDPRQLTCEAFFLDAPTIERHYRERANLIGAIDPRWGSRFSRALAFRLARRCGERMARDGGLDSETAARAWFFAIWTEICTLVPARHFARHLARQAKGELVVIPIASLGARYLGFWSSNELEPFYLAAELQRAGAHVVLLMTGDEGREAGGDEDLCLTFVPHPYCYPQTTGAEPDRREGPAAVLITSALRDWAQVKARCGDPWLLESTYSPMPGPFDFGLLPPGAPRPRVWTRSIVKRSSVDGGRVSLYSTETLPSDLVGELVETVGDLTQAAFQRATDLVGRFDVRSLHICDHAFFETALVAEATRRHGGSVSVWPHSSNAVHIETRARERLDHVTCITRAAAQTWLRDRPDRRITIDSSLMLRPLIGARPFVLGAPLSVVVIAGAHNLSRMPLMDAVGHRATYRALFAALAALTPTVNLVFKSKGHWETDAWLRGIVEDLSGVAFTDRHPNDIDLPNTIFLSISHASSALLEGIGRGIPGMVAREIPVEDYIEIDPRAIPTGDVATIASAVAACRDPAFFEELIARQRAWYAAETHFPPEGLHRQEL